MRLWPQHLLCKRLSGQLICGEPRRALAPPHRNILDADMLGPSPTYYFRFWPNGLRIFVRRPLHPRFAVQLRQQDGQVGL